MRREHSGLAFTTLELVESEARQGHNVELRQPDDAVLYGGVERPDVHLIHSQISPRTYHDRIPKFLWCHGEPLSSVGNGVSMRAIVDLAPLCEAFLAMRQDEWPIWQSIKKTYVVPKGIDLQRFYPLEDVAPHDAKQPASKLSGAPAVLYAEHWRGSRNPLYVCAAMERVAQRYPDARLHLFNCTDQKMHATFLALTRHAKWSTFLRTISGPVPEADVNRLYNRADVVASSLFPLYARVIEALGAGKPIVCPGYRVEDYPFRCELDPDSMAEAICQAWEASQAHQFDARAWAVRHHDVDETVRQAVAIYERYL
jgi:glycosyltransferase involved in cell wall biosynthesis